MLNLNCTGAFSLTSYIITTASGKYNPVGRVLAKYCDAIAAQWNENFSWVVYDSNVDALLDCLPVEDTFRLSF